MLSPTISFCSANEGEVRWLLAIHRESRMDRHACRGLRVSAIKRLSRWIIVKVAWAKLIATIPFLLPDLSHTWGHECPEERGEGQGRERPVSRRQENGEMEAHI